MTFWQLDKPMTAKQHRKAGKQWLARQDGYIAIRKRPMHEREELRQVYDLIDKKPGCTIDDVEKALDLTPFRAELLCETLRLMRLIERNG